jgi:hypothetical protein
MSQNAEDPESGPSMGEALAQGAGVLVLFSAACGYLSLVVLVFGSLALGLALSYPPPLGTHGWAAYWSLVASVSLGLLSAIVGPILLIARIARGLTQRTGSGC